MGSGLYVCKRVNELFMKNKKEAYFWKRHFNKAPNELHLIPNKAGRFNYRDSEIDDEFLYWITLRIKIIDQLDLDNTLVTNEGIKHLSTMEAIRELRLKGCGGIDNGCMEYLNKITSLELLHLGSTSIDLDDLKELGLLQNLKLLLVSSGESEAVIKEKVAVLKQMFPHCKMNVNHNIIY